jgi:hypothetical protein
MASQTANNSLDTHQIERLSTLALLLGILAVFQSNFVWLFWLGIALLAIGAVGTLASEVLKGQPLPRLLERLTIVGMMIGILGMLQPWQIWLYENGFYVLGISTLGFIIVSHIPSPQEE